MYTLKCDEELLNRLKDGDKAAFQVIYDRYSLPLFNWVMKKLGDEAESQDIIQDIFITLWDKHDSLHIQALPAYLFRTAHHKALNALCRHQYRTAHISALARYLSERTSAPEEALFEREFQLVLESEIERLPKQMKKIFELRKNEELSYQEISDLLGISKETVRTQIKRAIKNLKTRLKWTIESIILFIFFFLQK